MKRRTLLVVVVAALVAAIGIFFATRDDDEPTAEPDTKSVADAPNVEGKPSVSRHRSAPDRRPATASGIVTRADDGSPVAGAVVLMNAKGGPGSVATEVGVRARTLVMRTDDAGEFTFEGVPPGAYTMSATAKGFLPGRLANVEVQPASDVAGLKVALVSGGHRVSGNVQDIVGGPVEGAVVHALRLDEGSALSLFSRAPSGAMANEDGEYELWLPDGAYSLTAEHPDYVKATAQLRVDGGPRTRDITMTPGAAIEGTVVDRDGKPVAGALVRWVGTDELMAGGGGFGGGPAANMGMLERVETDESGHFRITGLEPGVRALSAVSENGATKQPVEVALGVAEEVSGVELVLDRAYKVSGIVVRDDADATPIEGVMLSTWSMKPPSAFPARSPSEEDGYFEIWGVPPGNYVVSAVSDEALPSFMGDSVEVIDADVDDLQIQLATGVHIRGRVEPAVPATIKLEIDMQSLGLMNMMTAIGNGFVRDRTAEDGTFDLSPVAASKVTIVATAEDGRTGEVDLDIGSDDIDDVVVTLEARARLAGRVVDATGTPVEGARVQVTLISDAPQMSMSFDATGDIPGGGEIGTTDEEGNYTVRGLEAGSYEVQVSPAKGPVLAWAKPDDPDDPKAPLVLELAAAEQRDNYELRVEAQNGVIRGRVVGADGAPLADAWVRASREQSAGEFMNELTQRFMKMAGAAAQKQAKRKPDPDRKASEGETMASRALSIQFAEEPVLTDETGSFEIKGLREGTYLVIGDGPKGTGRGQVTGVELGANIEIEVEPLGGISGVVESGGKPLAKYTLTVRGPDVRTRRINDDSGTFEIDRLDPGTYKVTVDAEEGVADQEVEIEASETKKLTLEIEGFGTLRGKLVDAAGEGISGVNVVVQGRSPDASNMMAMFSGGGPKTDDDGSFEVDRVRPGKGSISFVDPDASGFAPVGASSYELEGGGELDLGTITGIPAGDVAAEDRGDLGLSTMVATIGDRPLSPDDDGGEVTEETDETDEADTTKHLWVSSVALEGAAAAAGVEPGDEIVSIRGVDVDGQGAETAALTLGPGHVRAGEDVSIRIKRGSMTRKITIRARGRKSKKRK